MPGQKSPHNLPGMRADSTNRSL